MGGRESHIPEREYFKTGVKRARKLIAALAEKQIAGIRINDLCNISCKRETERKKTRREKNNSLRAGALPGRKNFSRYSRSCRVEALIEIRLKWLNCLLGTYIHSFSKRRNPCTLEHAVISRRALLSSQKEVLFRAAVRPDTTRVRNRCRASAVSFLEVSESTPAILARARALRFLRINNFSGP